MEPRKLLAAIGMLRRENELLTSDNERLREGASAEFVAQDGVSSPPKPAEAADGEGDARRGEVAASNFTPLKPRKRRAGPGPCVG